MSHTDLREQLNDLIEDAIEFGQADYSGVVRTEEQRAADYQKLLDAKQALNDYITQQVTAARIDMVNELFKGWTDTADGEHWKYMTKKHHDQIIAALQSTLIKKES